MEENGKNMLNHLKQYMQRKNSKVRKIQTKSTVIYLLREFTAHTVKSVVI